MTADPGLDVIVPVHNQRPLVEACLASVLATRNAIPFELLVVDDASTDRELKAWLAQLAEAGRLTLLTNVVNLGFTKSVNLGMQLHPNRDVLLLNSDTVVYADWLDRLRRAAYSQPRVASVNPLTNASHIGSYPYRSANGSVRFEISDQRLDALAAEVNRERRVVVHSTVGFCMYIRRAALDDLGYFDAEHFSAGYGEESDFCYRARKVGWRHLVTGDVFVRHWEGQSFGERKARLVAEMIDVFRRLHPDLAANDRNFAQRDPIRPLREALDLSRLKLLLAGVTELPCFASYDQRAAAAATPALLFDAAAGAIQFVVAGVDSLPNLPRHVLPAEVVAFNTMLAQLGIAALRFSEDAAASSFAARLRGRPMDVGLAATIVVATA
jgi:GT2 family glycosyltransferase